MVARLLLEAGADCSLKGTFQHVKKQTPHHQSGVTPAISDAHREVFVLSSSFAFFFLLLFPFPSSFDFCLLSFFQLQSETEGGLLCLSRIRIQN